MGLALLIVLTGAAASAAATERTPIAIFRDWGAFREGPSATPDRCFALAAPPPDTPAAGQGAFASVASWPARRVRAQLSIRLSHIPRTGSAVTLSIGEAGFHLLADGRQAWATDRHADALIVATMRSGSSMSVSGVSQAGILFADVYRLRGAASAIDAAMLACPMR